MNQTGQTPDISSNIDYTNYWTNNGCNSLPRFESHKEKVKLHNFYIYFIFYLFLILD